MLAERTALDRDKREERAGVDGRKDLAAGSPEGLEGEEEATEESCLQ
jgi:hypothetical protein